MYMTKIQPSMIRNVSKAPLRSYAAPIVQPGGPSQSQSRCIACRACTHSDICNASVVPMYGQQKCYCIVHYVIYILHANPQQQ